MKLTDIFKEKRTLIFFTIMILSTTLVYLNHFDNAFHFDDSHTIINNPNIRSLKNIYSFFRDGKTSSSLPQNQTYRPIVSTSLAIDYTLGKKLNPFFFHLDNYIFFIGQGLLIFFFFFKILNLCNKNKINFYIASGATLFYMLHPVMAETVNYIIARSDLQSTFFVILGFVLYQYSHFSKKYYLYLIPIVIGSLAKPTAIMFAPLLICYILFFENKVGFIHILKKDGFKGLLNSFTKSTPTIIACVLLYFFIIKMTPETYSTGGRNIFNYLITQPAVISYYFGSLFLPIHLSADTDWLPLKSMLTPQFILGIIFILILIYTTLITSKKKKLFPISFGLIWFFITLTPTSSIIPFSEVMNDHRMFFPYIGLVLALSYAIGLLYLKIKSSYKFKRNDFLIFGCLVYGLYGFGTFQRNQVWHSDHSLWKDVSEKSPKNGRGLMNYGLSLMAKGDYKNAETYFLQALKLTPNYHTLHINLGILYNATNRSQEAEKHFLKATKLGGNYYSSHYYYGNFLKNQNRIEEAFNEYQLSHKISPNHLPTNYALMDIYQNRELWDKLEDLATKTLKVDSNDSKTIKFLEAAKRKFSKIKMEEELVNKNPTEKGYLGLSVSSFQKKNYKKSIVFAEKTLKINPKSEAAYNNICISYTMLGNYTEAIKNCKKALSFKPNFQLAKNNLKEAQEKLNNSKKDQVNLNDLSKEIDYINLTLKLFNSKKYNKCIETALKGVKAYPNSIILYNNLCASYNEIKQWKKASDACKKGLQIDPNFQLLKNNYNYSLQQLNK